MTSQRKFYLTELIWLDKNEPYYREVYVTQHYVPLTGEFNARTKQNFSTSTVRNRLQSYRTWSDKRRLSRGPVKTLDLTTPKEKEPSKLRDNLGIEIEDKENIDLEGENGWKEDSEEDYVQNLFPDISNFNKDSPFLKINNTSSGKDFKKSYMDHYMSQEKNKDTSSPMSFQPKSSRSTKVNLEQVNRELDEKISKALSKKEIRNSKKEKKQLDECKITAWRHKGKKERHTKTNEYKLFKNGDFEGWKMVSQLTTQLQKNALENFKKELLDPEDLQLTNCKCGCNDNLLPVESSTEELLEPHLSPIRKSENLIESNDIVKVRNSTPKTAPIIIISAFRSPASPERNISAGSISKN